MTYQSEQQHDLKILERIEQDPETTQASLAAQLGVAVGTVNWHLKRLIDKGYVKVRRAQRRKLKYIITPEGISHRTHLTLDYINSSFQLYRLVRERMITALKELQPAGIKYVRLNGNGDVTEVCKLTCLEQGFVVIADPDPVPGKTIADFKIVGLKIFLDTPDSHEADTLSETNNPSGE